MVGGAQDRTPARPATRAFQEDVMQPVRLIVAAVVAGFALFVPFASSAAESFPAETPVRVYPVILRDGHVCIRRPE